MWSSRFFFFFLIRAHLASHSAPPPILLERPSFLAVGIQGLNQERWIKKRLARRAVRKIKGALRKSSSETHRRKRGGKGPGPCGRGWSEGVRKVSVLCSEAGVRGAECESCNDSGFPLPPSLFTMQFQQLKTQGVNNVNINIPAPSPASQRPRNARHMTFFSYFRTPSALCRNNSVLASN